MLKASRSIQRAAHADAGRPLPRVPELNTLYEGDFKLRFRQGQVCMIFGQSGSQKSGFMLFLAQRFGLKTLYFSADMEEHTAMTRLAALVTGDTTETIGQRIRKVAGADMAYAEELDDLPIHFVYDPNPTLETLYEEIAAYVEMYDAYPEVIVVDNLADMVIEGENEFSGQKQMMLELKSLARDTSASVFVLHHASESGGVKEANPLEPAPKSKIMGKVSATPNTILSVALDPSSGSPIFKISVVKQRTGPSDATGRLHYRFRCDPERGRFFPDNYHHQEAS